MSAVDAVNRSLPRPALFTGKERRVLLSLLTVTLGLLISALVTLRSSALVIRLDMVGGAVEVVALLVTLATLRKARQAPNEIFNYGLGKLENLCSLMLAMVQLVYLGIFVWIAATRLGQPAAVQGAVFGLALYVYGALVTGLMMRWTGRLAREQPSPVVQALHRGYQVKFVANLSTGAVLAVSALLPGQALVPYLDPLNVLALCALRLRTIWRMIGESGRDLVDAAVSEHLQLLILRALAEHFDHYDALLAIETRRSPARVFVTLRLGFDPARGLPGVFDSMEAIAAAIREAIGEAEVYVVPSRLLPG
jgi:divalent metal cation (Fe/Co/Zn/Cd) transporter